MTNTSDAILEITNEHKLSEWQLGYWNQIYADYQAKARAAQAAAQVKSQADAAFNDAGATVIGFVRAVIAELNLSPESGILADGTIQVK